MMLRIPMLWVHEQLILSKRMIEEESEYVVWMDSVGEKKMYD